MGMSFAGFHSLPGLLDSLRNVPEDLFTLDSAERVRLAMAVGALDRALERSLRPPHGFAWPKLNKKDGDCLTIVRNILAKCPDEAPSRSIKELTFITDERFRQTLSVDLGSAERALNGGEWKAATVLAGSVVEALLLWAIQQHELAERSAAMERAVTGEDLIGA